ncbi:hypothetical protein D3C81_1518070 [compost metagenome]
MRVAVVLIKWGSTGDRTRVPVDTHWVLPGVQQAGHTLGDGPVRGFYLLDQTVVDLGGHTVFLDNELIAICQ